MRNPARARVELATEKGLMIAHREHLTLVVEVTRSGCHVTASDDPQSAILHSLQFFDMRRFSDRMEDGSCIVKSWRNESLRGHQKEFLILPPIGAPESLKHIHLP